MGGRKSRTKGCRGELELAAELTRLLGVPCRRGRQYSGVEGRDVVGLPSIHVECKRTEKFNAYGALEQACRDRADGDTPVVFHRKNNEQWIVCVFLKDLVQLAERISDVVGKQ